MRLDEDGVGAATGYTPFDIDGPNAEIHECNECGALVNYDKTWRHNIFHQGIFDMYGDIRGSYDE